MRVIVRRLRAVLAGYHMSFDEAAVADARDRLKLLGSVLGTARDLEVRASAAEAVFVQLDENVDIAAARERVVEGSWTEFAAARDRVIAYLDGDAYVRLAAALIDLLKTGLDAPTTSSKQLIVHELKRTRKRIRRLKAQEPGTVAEFGALHEARKSARRLRYVAESIAANLKKHQSRYLTVAAAAEIVQDTLGDHRDRILLAEFLLFESKRAHAASEDTFALGAAHQENLRSAADARAASKHAIKGLTRTGRDW